MAQDHFVAQTYLKHFADSQVNGMLHAYRKADGQYFRCRPKDVCREWDGDLNPLLNHQGLLGDFRSMVEPHWNASVANLIAGQHTFHDKFVIAMYMANLMVCTPAWRRIGVTQHNQMYALWLRFCKRMKEKHGGQAELPVEAIAALERGEIVLDTNSDYVKGLATKTLMHYAWYIYNKNWSLFRNATTESFITSDNPVAWSSTAVPGAPIDRFLPITPELCLGVRFDTPPNLRSLTTAELDAGLKRAPQGAITMTLCDASLAQAINCKQAMSAEEIVFSSNPSKGIEELVSDVARFRLEVRSVEFKDPHDDDPDSVIHGSTISVEEAARGSNG